MADDAGFYFTDTVLYDEKAVKKLFKPASLEPLRLLLDQLEVLDEFKEADLENAFKAVMEKTGLKLGKIAQPVRLALTGKTASPGIFEIIEIIGKDSVLSRIKDAIKFIEDRKG